ncbi:hypothetical protein OH76DRAFT_694517 [Lentinus brumalis]|uniref:Uncharacterized protein n=1 Tax=Lentinus brumalis TaxID=2498619 RepID=A0A371D666_9APHY|nr:hypothetical protein OH76DRAFT_694517 [Polyporus brumalis]
MTTTCVRELANTLVFARVRDARAENYNAEICHGKSRVAMTVLVLVDSTITCRPTASLRALQPILANRFWCGLRRTFDVAQAPSPRRLSIHTFTAAMERCIRICWRGRLTAVSIETTKRVTNDRDDAGWYTYRSRTPGTWVAGGISRSTPSEAVCSFPQPSSSKTGFSPGPRSPTPAHFHYASPRL